MNINPSPESQAKVKLDKLFSDSSINSNPSISAQARNSYELYQMIAGLIMVYEVLGLTQGACSALMIQAGFNSADETANAGHLYRSRRFSLRSCWLWYKVLVSFKKLRE